MTDTLQFELSRLLDKHGLIEIRRTVLPGGDIKQIVFLGDFYFEHIIDHMLIDVCPDFLASETAQQIGLTDEALDMEIKKIRSDT